MNQDQLDQVREVLKVLGFASNANGTYTLSEAQITTLLYAAPQPQASPQEPVVACHLHRYSDRIECVYGGEVLPADWRYMPTKYTDLIPLGQSVTFYAAPQPQASTQAPSATSDDVRDKRIADIFAAHKGYYAGTHDLQDLLDAVSIAGGPVHTDSDDALQAALADARDKAQTADARGKK